MSTLSDLLDAYRRPEREETLLERAVRRELKRIDSVQTTQRARPLGTAPIPPNPAPEATVATR